MATYQTLPQFLDKPFGKQTNIQKMEEYSKRYSQYLSSAHIKLESIAVIEESYYFHISIPSESQKDTRTKYDVVIRFFTDDPAVANEDSLKNYHIQFFSNSPGFIYQYAYVYKTRGYLIQMLYDKLDKEYINVAPTKTNASLDLSFDSSIYYACRFLNDSSLKYLNKSGSGLLFKKVSPTRFFSGITDFTSKKFDQLLAAEEKKLSENLQTAKKEYKESKNSTKEPKKNATSSTNKTTHVVSPNKKITGSAKVVKKTTPKSKV